MLEEGAFKYGYTLKPSLDNTLMAVVKQCCLLFLSFQNLRDALDSMFDAKVPIIWKKVCGSI